MCLNSLVITAPTMSAFYMLYLVFKSRIHCYPLTGGFYSDNLGHVAENCKKCPNGSFVAYDKAPGTRAQDCKSCPHGKQLFYSLNLFLSLGVPICERLT